MSDVNTQITQNDALGSVITPAMARSAALTVAAHLGPDCRDILDALGLTGPIEQPVPYRRERILHHGGRLVGHRIGGGAR